MVGGSVVEVLEVVEVVATVVDVLEPLEVGAAATLTSLTTVEVGAAPVAGTVPAEGVACDVEEQAEATIGSTVPNSNATFGRRSRPRRHVLRHWGVVIVSTVDGERDLLGSPR